MCDHVLYCIDSARSKLSNLISTTQSKVYKKDIPKDSSNNIKLVFSIKLKTIELQDVYILQIRYTRYDIYTLLTQFAPFYFLVFFLRALRRKLLYVMSNRRKFFASYFILFFFNKNRAQKCNIYSREEWRNIRALKVLRNWTRNDTETVRTERFHLSGSL